MAKRTNNPSIKSVTKGSRVNRRNVYAQAHSKRGGAGAGPHGDRSKFNRNVKHRNQVEY